MRGNILCLAGGVLGLALAATAQGAPAGRAERIHGTIERFDGHALAVHTLDGQDLTIAMPHGVRISALAERKLSDIKSGDFVGSAAVKGQDGRLHAQEVHIFPASMRGTGEGHRPMGEPEQTMTNAVVDGVAGITQGGGRGGEVLTLKYPGGEQRIEVAPGTRVVKLIPGDDTLLKPGAAVMVLASKSVDGALTARLVQAEKDGVKPLM